MSEIPQEAIDRMVKLVRAMNGCQEAGSTLCRARDYWEAREIAALPPEPVDPDLAEVEKLLDAFWASPNHGSRDLAMAALKRGRELESGK